MIIKSGPGPSMLRLRRVAERLATRCHHHLFFGAIRESFSVRASLLEQQPNNFRHSVRDHGDRDVFVFATRTRVAVDAAKAATKLDRAPARLNQRPAQPLVTLPQEPAQEYKPEPDATL